MPDLQILKSEVVFPYFLIYLIPLSVMTVLKVFSLNQQIFVLQTYLANGAFDVLSSHAVAEEQLAG